MARRQNRDTTGSGVATCDSLSSYAVRGCVIFARVKVAPYSKKISQYPGLSSSSDHGLLPEQYCYNYTFASSIRERMVAKPPAANSYGSAHRFVSRTDTPGNLSPLKSRSISHVRHCSHERSAPFNLWFPPLLQSFAPATHAKPSRLSACNVPLGLWAGLYVESRSRGIEEKGQSPPRLRAVDTPLAVDCGSCVIPFLAGYSPSFPNHPSRAGSHNEHATIHIAP